MKRERTVTWLVWMTALIIGFACGTGDDDDTSSSTSLATSSSGATLSGGTSSGTSGAPGTSALTSSSGATLSGGTSSGTSGAPGTSAFVSSSSFSDSQVVCSSHTHPGGSSSIVSSSGPSSSAASSSGGISTFIWESSLVFQSQPAPGELAPTNAQNIVAHQGKLFAGFATVFDGNYGQKMSYVFRKDAAGSDWVLDATFPEGTLRVDSLLSVTFAHDGHGVPIPGGPVTRLLAATNKGGQDLAPVRVWVRDDSNGQWLEQQVSAEQADTYEARNLGYHRDPVTGADMVFVAASPAPFGIYAGVYDAAVPGGIRWHPQPEQSAECEPVAKWFGLDEANGNLFASCRDGVFRRTDGAFPSTWVRVVNADSPAGTPNPELRGLTGVRNSAGLTGWPEDEMLIFSWQSRIYRMRAAPPYDMAVEIDLMERLAADTGRTDLIYAEAIPNTVPAHLLPGALGPIFPIGFQVVFGDPGGTTVAPRDLFNPGDMSGINAFARQAFYYERDENGAYGPLQRIESAAEPGREMIWARDWASSPFQGEEGWLYAAGYNISVSQHRGEVGQAWVYRGRLAGDRTYEVGSFDQTLKDSSRNRDVTVRVRYPRGLSGAAPVILISHGGNGSPTGYTTLEHLGIHYAAKGYVAVHVNHLPSTDTAQHRLDRPADVSFVIDAISTSTLMAPVDFVSSIDTARIGHIGHSWGSYTSMALAGGRYDHALNGELQDARIIAHVNLSPQGPDQFGSFDRGVDDNTWQDITKPMFNMVGGLEKDGSGECGDGNIQVPGWRLVPYLRLPSSTTGEPTKFQAVIPGCCHSDMANQGDEATQAYISQNSRVFFDVFVKGQPQEMDMIGQLAPIAGVEFASK